MHAAGLTPEGLGPSTMPFRNSDLKCWLLDLLDSTIFTGRPVLEIEHHQISGCISTPDPASKCKGRWLNSKTQHQSLFFLSTRLVQFMKF